LTSTTTTSAAAAATAHRYPREAAGPVFLVEDVECSKTHVGYFLFVKNEALIGCGVQRLRKVHSRKSGCGCASHQRKTQSGGAQSRHTSGFGQTLPLRSLLHPGHAASSMCQCSVSNRRASIRPGLRDRGAGEDGHAP
jgi:hypothetical protein